MTTIDGRQVIPAADLPKRSAGRNDALVGVVSTGQNLAAFPLSGLPTPDAAQAELDALKAGQQTSAIYADSLAALRSVQGTYQGQGGFVNNGEGAGQYIWSGSAWVFSRADILSQKADRSTVDPMVSVVSRLRTVYTEDHLPSFAYSWTCPHPSNPWLRLVAGGIQGDGTLKFSAAAFGDARVSRLSVAEAIDGSMAGYPRKALPGYAHNIFDAENRAAGGVKDDGTLHYHSAEFDYINGRSIDEIIEAGQAEQLSFAADINFVANHGQSLAKGPGGAVSTVQKYDTIAFPAHSTSPAAWALATAASASEGGNKEIPAFGAADCVKELLAAEDGIAFTDQAYQLLIGNAAYGGYSIGQLEKGTPPYAELMGQVQAGFNIAQQQDKLFAATCMWWIQGEGNYTSTQTAYRTRLVQLARDFDADCRLVTGQAGPTYLIASQTTSQGQVDYSRSVQLAMVDAQSVEPLVVLAAPQYMYTYLLDEWLAHVDAASTRLLGAYLGLAYKRTVIEGRKWRPLMPIAATVQGRVIYLRFNKSGLRLDTDLVPAQPNFGISLRTSSNAEHQITSVAVAQPDVLKIVCAAPVPLGVDLWLGGKTAVGINNYQGGATNIRDSQGDDRTFDNYPLHNWAVISKIKVS
ncbi:sialate O-acetylesterase [Stenotrophomonas lactitubi]|uniref:sialate O-acetylesterase n=1 Tax=Stenotrophomonas lactitubi TaxID=2045214 RepID=UPI00203B77FC|nr:sialate O-acetylesterase [Stenotrophomonas lactitubi]